MEHPYTKAITLSNGATLTKATNGIYIATTGSANVIFEGDYSTTNVLSNTITTLYSLPVGFHNLKIKKVIDIPANSLGLY